VTEPLSRIETALAQLGAEHEPSAGWEDKVLAQVEQGAWWRRLVRWKIGLPIAAIAAAAIAIVLLIPRERPLALALDYRKSGELFRGEMHGVGERMRAVATGGDGHRAVWVYCDDRLVAACPGGSGCVTSDDETVAEVVLKTAGRYAVVALTSRSPISAPGGAFDRDVAGAQQAGVMVRYEYVTVR
jgi:hypothetical protein